MRDIWAIIREPNRAGWVVLANGFWRGRNFRIGERKARHHFSGYMESVSRPNLAILELVHFRLCNHETYIAGAGKTKLASVFHLIGHDIK